MYDVRAVLAYSIIYMPSSCWHRPVSLKKRRNKRKPNQDELESHMPQAYISLHDKTVDSFMNNVFWYWRGF